MTRPAERDDRPMRYQTPPPGAAFALALASALTACAATSHPAASSSRYIAARRMLVRFSEIEIEPSLLPEYLSILQDESAASIRLEPGVISIFPMQQQET